MRKAVLIMSSCISVEKSYVSVYLFHHAGSLMSLVPFLSCHLQNENSAVINKMFILLVTVRKSSSACLE